MVMNLPASIKAEQDDYDIIAAQLAVIACLKKEGYITKTEEKEQWEDTIEHLQNYYHIPKERVRKFIRTKGTSLYAALLVKKAGGCEMFLDSFR